MKEKLTWTATWMAAIAASAVGAWAQTPVRLLHVIALDKSGQPVTDLNAKDLRLADAGKTQSILSLQPNDGRTVAAEPHSVIILFDLLNNDYLDRGYVAGTILHSLERAKDPDNIYLYILTNKATVYPVRALPAPGTPARDHDWTLHAKDLIDDAINHVFGVRPVDQRFEANRVAESFEILSHMASVLAKVPGRKSIVWSTRGFPAMLRFVSSCPEYTFEDIHLTCQGTAFDFTPVLHRVAAEMVQAGITLYAVDEADSVDPVLARAMLTELTGATGGKVYTAGLTPAALAEASAGLRFYYSLSYQPADGNWDGKFHRVKLTCSNKDVQLLAEAGYVADAPAK